MDARRCCHCRSTTEELRPYGPQGKDVCFPCAMLTPERRAQAEMAFSTRLALDEIAGVSTIIREGHPDDPAKEPA